MKKGIGVILGSDSDFPHMEEAIKLIKTFDVPFDVVVSSAHRTPERTIEIVRDFEKKKIAVIITAAGGAAHLPGVVASHTLLPVLGVPIPSPLLSGVDSLYSIVQMPGGIPVATFGIGVSGGVNAVLFALEILASEDKEIERKLKKFRQDWKEKVKEKDRKLREKINSL